MYTFDEKFKKGAARVQGAERDDRIFRRTQ